jgi:DNA-binding NarL/FixJ family response regulator
MAGADLGPKIVSVVVAEDHPSIRENLRYILNAERDMTCVELPDLDGIDVALRLRRLAPAVRIILYSAEPTIPELARRARLAGFVVKGAPVDELLTAVRRSAFAPRTQPRLERSRGQPDGDATD